MSRRRNTSEERTVRVYEVLVQHDSGGGPAGDGTMVHRFHLKHDAEEFARGRRCYGGPASVNAFDAPLRLAERWGMA